MAENTPQASASDQSKPVGGSEPVQQESLKGQETKLNVHPSSVVQTTTTTTKTMDVNGKPTQVQETVKTGGPQATENSKPSEAKKEKKEPKLSKTDVKVISALMKDGASYDDAKKAVLKNKDDKPEKKRHWMSEVLDERMARYKNEGEKPKDWMVGFKFGYQTVQGFFILAEKLGKLFGPKPAQAGVTAKQGTVAGLQGKKDGTLNMLKNAGISSAKPAPGQKPSVKPTVSTKIKQTAGGMAQGAQKALKTRKM